MCAGEHVVTTLTANSNSIQSDEPRQTLVLSGRSAAKELRSNYAREIAGLKARYGLLPGLAVVRAGEDPASLSYAARITQSFEAAGLSVTLVALADSATRALLQAEISRLNVLPEIAGVIVQMPLPEQIGLEAITDVLDPEKDVDGLHPVNAGRLMLGLDCYVPATPAGGIALLDHYGIPIQGKRALVVGRSSVVGKPLAQLLLARNATVTMAHSHSRDLSLLVAEADLVASATGKPALIKGSMLKEGVVALDFGASVVDGQMVGDIEYNASLGRAEAITPVPGGTGPMTNAMLLKNMVKAVRRHVG